MLDRYATYTGSDPRRAPAALATVPYVEQSFGAWYVRGGLRRLGEALHERGVVGREDRAGVPGAQHPGGDAGLHRLGQAQQAQGPDVPG